MEQFSVLLRALSDSQFHREMESAAHIHQSSTINILHCINELDRRKSYLDQGYSSVFDYCVRKLKYSSSTAGRLIQAARCVRRNPDMLAMLQAREVSVSTICLIEPILDEKNKKSLLERVRGASRREVERIACEYRPPLAFRDRMTPVRVSSASVLVHRAGRYAMPVHQGPPSRSHSAVRRGWDERFIQPATVVRGA